MKWSVPLMWAGLIFAQGRPAFEAASVKASAAGDSGMSMHWGPGQVEWTDTSLRYFVQTAYGVHDYAYSGPAWLDSALYDVVAKLPANGNSNRYPDMLQTLLAERFKLVVHRETKDLPGLALMVDKRGPRIKPVEPGDSGWGSGSNMVQGRKASLAQFADALSTALNRPVKDFTGLPGVYDIKIQWMPDLPTSSEPGNLPGSVYAAVQELGFRLRVQNFPVEVVVVDHVERVPTQN